MLIWARTTGPTPANSHLPALVNRSPHHIENIVLHWRREAPDSLFLERTYAGEPLLPSETLIRRTPLSQELADLAAAVSGKADLENTELRRCERINCAYKHQNERHG